MEIIAENLGKRFTHDWIFRDLSFHIHSGESIAILGPNGSGKSSLLKVIAGIILNTEGVLKHKIGSSYLSIDQLYKEISISAPYLELIEELTLREFLKFHYSFKKLTLNSIDELIEILALDTSANKQIKFFSSGMKQRVKLALCFFSKNSLIFLDEPTTNLDTQGIDWYKEYLSAVPEPTTTIICSNREVEYESCIRTINLELVRN